MYVYIKMSKLLSIIVKTFDNLITLNNKDISIVFDINKKIWFSLRDVFKALDYKDIKKEIKRIDLDEKHITIYSKIYINNNDNDNDNDKKKKHPQMVMIDEAGIYKLLDKSTKPLAKQFRDELFTNILPEYRQTGNIKSNSSDKLKLKKLTKRLQLLQKEQSMKKLTTKKYTKYINSTKKGFIYILKVKKLRDGIEKICYKIGYATNLNKRLETYKTGHPDIELVYQENVNISKEQLEKCILFLNLKKRLSSKNEIICNISLKEIISQIKDCKILIEKYN
jgi:prophage antirepressor-like protein